MTLAAADQFVQWFRAATPYIHAFRGHTFVIAFGGEVVADGKFTALTHDLNLLASLGVRLVLVHGARPQVEEMLSARGAQDRYIDNLRITDDLALQCVKEANGRLRVEIEAQLSMGLPNSPMAGADIRVASGNFVTAKPIGVVHGVDLLHTGAVRKINAAAIRNRLDDGEIVLLSPLGYSPTGEIFNLTLEDVATSAATALAADKLVFLMNEAGVVDAEGELQRELNPVQAEALLAQNDRLTPDSRVYLPCALRACRHGVGRAHLISRHDDGALLMELFTHTGVGTMVTKDALENLRQAKIDDVGGILALLEPLEADGTLVRRSRELLEMEISRFAVLERDHVIVGCAALYPFPSENAGELACLAVHPEYRNAGSGERLLHYIEARAREHGCKRLFVLTTRTAHWFVERGFQETDVAALPREKQVLYNFQRRSKIFVKGL
ncbi:MAG: amino-acid N-acetyltransferase [Pseudomonadota bacterium]